jgi:hypothetical protein
MLLQACLGLRVDAIRNTLEIVHPRLPTDIDQLHLLELKVGESCIDLHFERIGKEGVVVNAENRSEASKLEINLRI